MAAELVLRRADQGRINGAFGLPRCFKVTAEESGGSMTVWSEDVPVGGGPPLHVHHREHELFYVVSGRLLYQCAETRAEAAAGAVVMIPPAAPHTFLNIGDSTASMIVTMTPGGIEGMFEEVEAEGLVAGPATMPRIAEIAARYNLSFVGPPLTR